MNNDILQQYKQVLKTFDYDNKYFSKVIPNKEIYLLYEASLKIILERCYQIISKEKITKIKKIAINEIENEKKLLDSSLIPTALTRSIRAYNALEMEKIEKLSKIKENIENSDEEKILEQILSAVLGDLSTIEKLKQEQENITKKNLSEISYDNKLCVENDVINHDVIEKICKYIYENNLTHLITRVYKALDNDEEFQKLEEIRDNADKFINWSFINIYHERINRIKEELKNDKLLAKELNNTQNLDEELINIYEKFKAKFKKKFILKSKKDSIEFIIKGIESIFNYQEKIDQLMKMNENFEPREALVTIYKTTNLYQGIRKFKQQNNIESNRDWAVEKLVLEIEEIEEKLKQSINEDSIATEEEKKVIIDFAQHLSASIESARNLLNNDKIFSCLVTNWCTKLITEGINNPKQAEYTISEINTNWEEQSKKLNSSTIHSIPYAEQYVKNDNYQIQTKPKGQTPKINRKILK